MKTEVRMRVKMERKKALEIGRRSQYWTGLRRVNWVTKSIRIRLEIAYELLDELLQWRAAKWGSSVLCSSIYNIGKLAIYRTCVTDHKPNCISSHWNKHPAGLQSQSPFNIVTSLLRRNTREEKPSHIEQTFKDLKTKNPKGVAARQGEAITTEGLFQFSLAGSWRRQRYLTTTRGGKVRFNTYEARAKVFIHTLTTQQTWRPGSPFRSWRHTARRRDVTGSWRMQGEVGWCRGPERKKWLRPRSTFHREETSGGCRAEMPGEINFQFSFWWKLGASRWVGLNHWFSHRLWTSDG